MSTHLTRPAVLAASLVAAGTLLAVPGTAQASSTPHTSASGSAAEASARGSGVGLKKFQERHGLPRTGSVDRATAKALGQASEAELHQTFTTAADLGPEELANARTVIGVGKGAGIPEQGQVIALMTAMQESKFVNYLTPVDHDSLGIFQQRPSTGWGTPEQITDVPTSSKSFYGVADFGTNPGLIQIEGWETMPPGDVCQAVQVSAYPDRYAQWEQFARDLLAQEGPTVPPIP
ncbi:peptidoglycan-binding domain-containing protein [Streptomyces reniochalinae]|uniref:Peptidoglycan-binding protein n=1 Tax=Streptomyces reniochalinae TaxID=2250578 RepID=A0A367EIZ0_9ACTN|nr:peptidoglycan-binding domain-containing protein [Streptomyces reniochalinae]RCG17605.1 peptidoglycan-binding protein [Streptomyces reniochalinae]